MMGKQELHKSDGKWNRKAKCVYYTQNTTHNDEAVLLNKNILSTLQTYK